MGIPFEFRALHVGVSSVTVDALVEGQERSFTVPRETIHDFDSFFEIIEGQTGIPIRKKIGDGPVLAMFNNQWNDLIRREFEKFDLRN